MVPRRQSLEAECAIFAEARELITAVTADDCDSQTVVHEIDDGQSWSGLRIEHHTLIQDLPKAIELSLRSLGFAT